MTVTEQVLSFSCDDATLYGIASVPAQPARRGVLIVVGGPQYRVGSHRQFTLLARSLAAQGVATMRFDYRGMGDSDGAARSFEEVEPDLRAAIDCFMATVPALDEVVMWGLCDAASAAMFYAANDARISGLVLLNPWARTSGGIAKTTLKHYYRGRLLEGALWKKIFSGRFDYAASARSFLRLVRNTVRPARRAAMESSTPGGADRCATHSLPDRMLAGLAAYRGRVLLILSGADLTAQEFLDMANASRAWRRELAAPRVTQQRLQEADHTFSRRAWRDQVASWTGDWVKSW